MVFTLNCATMTQALTVFLLLPRVPSCSELSRALKQCSSSSSLRCCLLSAIGARQGPSTQVCLLFLSATASYCFIAAKLVFLDRSMLLVFVIASSEPLTIPFSIRFSR
ncbi:hypothetical protein PVAP13_8NG127302 [Panicum virgatum]|uniref:Secreted protein n=1 Tax=Panicum virgatum TaxID=38727 RepID=A0A8T0PGA6_PANVG|nr:hypothetical protein PVAP13_8NG127302 [Panicum virgatum]